MNSEFLITYLFTVVFASLFVNLGLSLYGLFYRHHYTKKLIMLSIMGDTVNAFAIFIGYRAWPSESSPPRPAILLEYPFNSTSVLAEFTGRAVDPLPQALVLTAVVIGLAVLVYLVFLGDQLYKKYGTLDMRRIRRLRA